MYESKFRCPIPTCRRSRRVVGVSNCPASPHTWPSDLSTLSRASPLGFDRSQPPFQPGGPDSPVVTEYSHASDSKFSELVAAQQRSLRHKATVTTIDGQFFRPKNASTVTGGIVLTGVEIHNGKPRLADPLARAYFEDQQIEIVPPPANSEMAEQIFSIKEAHGALGGGALTKSADTSL